MFAVLICAYGALASRGEYRGLLSYQISLILFFYYVILLFFFFFFQAEDGIRDVAVTGVQTCALPIWPGRRRGCGFAARPGRWCRCPCVHFSIYNRLFTMGRDGDAASPRRAARADPGDRKSGVEGKRGDLGGRRIIKKKKKKRKEAEG